MDPLYLVHALAAAAICPWTLEEALPLGRLLCRVFRGGPAEPAEALQLPSAPQLDELLCQVMGDWGIQLPRPAVSSAPSLGMLPMRCGAVVMGPRGCVLALRSTRAFAEALAYAGTGDPHAREQADDALMELCLMLGVRLQTRFLGGTEGGIEPCASGQWPDRLSDVSAAVLIGDQRVEARLWSLHGPGLEAGEA